MKNKFTKSTILLGLVVLLTVVIIPITISAYSGSYSFNIAHQVQGSTTHSLSNKSTNTRVSANTYASDSETITSAKSKYEVTLVGGWFRSYNTGNINANGLTYIRDFGTVSSRDYTVTVTKTEAGPYGQRVIGSGTIRQ